MVHDYNLSTQELKRLKQDYKFVAILGNIVRPCSKKRRKMEITLGKTIIKITKL
jgi:hypothetical protein